MPTPATHLASAQAMLRQGTLSLTARRLVDQHRGAFLLGHTAPDVKTISGQNRQATHFYSVPRASDHPAYQVLFDTHPGLADHGELSPAQTAFIAGYIAHLLLDERWLADVFEPCFMGDWGSRAERMFLHNVLRTWVDARDQQRLDRSVPHALREAEPEDWLPFVDDRMLRRWRDWLAEQLAPGNGMETAAVLAPRVGARAEEMMSVAGSSEQMEHRVFRHISRPALQAFRDTSQRHCVRLVNWYIARSVARRPSRSGTDWSGRLRAREEVRL